MVAHPCNSRSGEVKTGNYSQGSLASEPRLISEFQARTDPVSKNKVVLEIWLTQQRCKPEFVPQNPNDGRREVTPRYLVAMCALWHMSKLPVLTHTKLKCNKGFKQNKVDSP